MSNETSHELTLRYGLNPNQRLAWISFSDKSLPLEIISGVPSLINILDALRSWKLVRELRRRLGRPAAASYKHVNPAGVGLGGELPVDFCNVHFLEGTRLSPLASAYLRARQADRISSYGDFAALSDVVDGETAMILAKVASDGVIAPGFTPEALELLRRKRGGRYLVLGIDPDFEPPRTETRTEFGLTLCQETDETDVVDPSNCKVVSRAKLVTITARDDLLLAAIVAKHTQSNAAVIAMNGQAIGIGAGQQSRIAATELACRKADTYRLLFHPKLQNVGFVGSPSRIEKMNTVELLTRFDQLDRRSRQFARGAISEDFSSINDVERDDWLQIRTSLCLASDAFIPFRDNIDRAVRSGVTHIMQTGGSLRDAEVTAAADERGMVMLHSGQRTFLH